MAVLTSTDFFTVEVLNWRFFRKLTLIFISRVDKLAHQLSVANTGETGVASGLSRE
jgi:hypothetical protein